MKADEVEKLIQSDSSLRRMRTHTASFRSELESLERVFEAKLHTLQREHDQLLVRNEKLAKLSKKVHADQLAQVEARSRSMSIASDVSSCASSPPHSYRRQDSQSSTSSFSAASSRQSTPPGSPASVLHI
jgi:hypothetical protein